MLIEVAKNSRLGWTNWRFDAKNLFKRFFVESCDNFPDIQWMISKDFVETKRLSTIDQLIDSYVSLGDGFGRAVYRLFNYGYALKDYNIDNNLWIFQCQSERISLTELEVLEKSKKWRHLYEQFYLKR